MFNVLTLKATFICVLFQTAWSNLGRQGSSKNAHNKEEQEYIIVSQGPYFDKNSTTNITTIVGKTAYLTCKIKNLKNQTVSWIRHRDLHLLTVDRSTYTSDQRFQCVHNPMAEEWTLQVRYPQQKDSGIYECQVGTTPPIGLTMMLSVIEPITTLLGSPELYINQGSTLNLTCIVKHKPQPAPKVSWTHNSQGISFDSPRGGISIITEKSDITVSYLIIQRAQESDSGRYSCEPTNANYRTVIVHVLKGEHPEAMQGGQLMVKSSCFLYFFVNLFIKCIN